MVNVASQRENDASGKRKPTGPTPSDRNKRAKTGTSDFSAQPDTGTEDTQSTASQTQSPSSFSATQAKIIPNEPPKYYECPEPYIDDEDERHTWQSYLRPTLTMLITQVVSRPETNYSYESILLIRHLCFQYNKKENNLLDFLENKVGIWNLTKHAKKIGGFDFELSKATPINEWILHYHSVMKTINYDMKKWQSRKDSLVYQYQGTSNYIPFTWTKLEEHEAEFSKFTHDVLIQFAKNKRMAISFNRMMASCFDNMSMRSQEHDNDLVGIWSKRCENGADWFGDLVHAEAADMANTEEEYLKMSTNILKMMDEVRKRKKTTVFTKKQIRARLLAADPATAKKIAQANGSLRSQLSRQRLREAELAEESIRQETRRVYWNFLCTRAYIMYINEGDTHHPPAEIREAVRYLVDQRESSDPDDSKFKPSPTKVPGLRQSSDDSSSGSDEEDEAEQESSSEAKRNPQQSISESSCLPENDGKGDSCGGVCDGSGDVTAEGSQENEPSAEGSQEEAQENESTADGSCVWDPPQANISLLVDEKDHWVPSSKKGVTLEWDRNIGTYGVYICKYLPVKIYADLRRVLQKKKDLNCLLLGNNKNNTRVLEWGTGQPLDDANPRGRYFRLGGDSYPGGCPAHCQDGYANSLHKMSKALVDAFGSALQKATGKTFSWRDWMIMTTVGHPSHQFSHIDNLEAYEKVDQDAYVLIVPLGPSCGMIRLDKLAEGALQYVEDNPSRGDEAFLIDYREHKECAVQEYQFLAIPQGSALLMSWKEFHGGHYGKSSVDGVRLFAVFSTVKWDDQYSFKNPQAFIRAPEVSAKQAFESIQDKLEETFKTRKAYHNACDKQLGKKEGGEEGEEEEREEEEDTESSQTVEDEEEASARVLQESDVGNSQLPDSQADGSQSTSSKPPPVSGGSDATTSESRESCAAVDKKNLPRRARLPVASTNVTVREKVTTTTTTTITTVATASFRSDGRMASGDRPQPVSRKLNLSEGEFEVAQKHQPVLEIPAKPKTTLDDGFKTPFDLYFHVCRCEIEKQSGKKIVCEKKLNELNATIKQSWDSLPEDAIDLCKQSWERIVKGQPIPRQELETLIAKEDSTIPQLEGTESEEGDRDTSPKAGKPGDQNAKGEIVTASKSNKADDCEDEVVVEKVVPPPSDEEMKESEDEDEEDSDDEEEEGFSPNKLRESLPSPSSQEKGRNRDSTETQSNKTPIPVKEFPNKKRRYRMCTNEDLDGHVFDFLIRSAEAAVVYSLENHPLQVWTTTREHEYVCAYRIRTDGGDFRRESDSSYPLLNIVRGVRQFRTYCRSVSGVRLAEGGTLMGWDCLNEITINHNGQLYLCLRLDVIMDALLNQRTQSVEKRNGCLRWRLPSSNQGGDGEEGSCEYCIHKVFGSNFGNNKDFLAQVGKIAKFAWGCHKKLRSIKDDVISEWENGKAGKRLRGLLGIGPKERMGFQKAVVEVYRLVGIFVHDFSEDTVIKQPYQYTVRLCLPVASTQDGRIYQTIFKFECGKLHGLAGRVPFKV